MKNLAIICFLLLGCIKIYSQELYPPRYNNPIIPIDLPDPTVIKAQDGFFYLYATEHTPNIPIFRSKDLVNWDFVGTAFTDTTHPSFLKEGRLWAPDINYIGGQYVLYYTLSKWSEENENGIGVAVSKNPEGPFFDLGKLFTSDEIGVINSIDEFYYEEKGKKYLFWGGGQGIYGIELSKNGLSIKKGSPKRQVAGKLMEATAIEKRNGYYYLFTSKENCCEGANSKYHIIYGRSKKLFGPYVNKEGKSMMDGFHDVLIHRNDKVAGPGHQSRIVKDDKGQDWLIYHGYLKNAPEKGRIVFMDKIEWNEGWPSVKGDEPSEESISPFFKH